MERYWGECIDFTPGCGVDCPVEQAGRCKRLENGIYLRRIFPAAGGWQTDLDKAPRDGKTLCFLEYEEHGMVVGTWEGEGHWWITIQGEVIIENPTRFAIINMETKP